MASWPDSDQSLFYTSLIILILVPLSPTAVLPTPSSFDPQEHATFRLLVQIHLLFTIERVLCATNKYSMHNNYSYIHIKVFLVQMGKIQANRVEERCNIKVKC